MSVGCQHTDSEYARLRRCRAVSTAYGETARCDLKPGHRGEHCADRGMQVHHWIEGWLMPDGSWRHRVDYTLEQGRSL